jgi:hypothetical protein
LVYTTLAFRKSVVLGKTLPSPSTEKINHIDRSVTNFG